MKKQKFETAVNSILEKVKFIISIKEENQSPEDKLFIEYIKFLYMNEYKSNKLIWPIKYESGETIKVKMNYIRNYVDVLYFIFKSNFKERNEYYLKNQSVLGNDMMNKLSNNDNQLKNNLQFNKGKLIDKVKILMWSYLNANNKNT